MSWGSRCGHLEAEGQHLQQDSLRGSLGPQTGGKHCEQRVIAHIVRQARPVGLIPGQQGHQGGQHLQQPRSGV